MTMISVKKEYPHQQISRSSGRWSGIRRVDLIIKKGENVKKILKILAVLFISAIVSGCSLQARDDVKSEFTYVYDVKGSKEELFTKARDFFANAYGDSRKVFSVQEKSEGKFIGKGIVSWTLPLYVCGSNYSIAFRSKENKAQLKLKLLRAIPAGSACGWDWPSEAGYNEIVQHFNEISKNLELRLQKKEEDF